MNVYGVHQLDAWTNLENMALIFSLTEEVTCDRVTFRNVKMTFEGYTFTLPVMDLVGELKLSQYRL